MAEIKVILAIEDAVASITLNRPAKLNAIDLSMLGELEAVCRQIEQDRTVRVVLITGAGKRAFSAGADITAWSTAEPLDMWRQWIRAGHRVFDQIAHLRQPVIALLNGYALGGGLELALAADLRLAAESAQLGLLETTLGAIPGWHGSQRLPKLIGPARAKQMVLTGARVDAATAERWGLVNEVVPDDSLRERGLALAGQIAANAPIAVQVAKQLVNSAMGEATALALESLASGMVSQTEDVKIGTAAYREPDSPQFKDR